MSEFSLIDRFFKSITAQYPQTRRADVALGIGDDCALLNVPAGKQLAVSTDTLISGVHFPEQTAPQDIGYKSLAVNLSDLAAMGATPAWVSLAITLPEQNEKWLQGFVSGFAELCRQYQLQLIGGDTTHGTLSITVQVFGFVDNDLALRRDQACAGDDIYVSGSIGDGVLGLHQLLNHQQQPESCIQHLNRPTARVELGQKLLGISRCAIDISDGLLSDVGHLTEQSQLAAVIDVSRVPLSEDLSAFYQYGIDWSAVLNGGDDYELCFTLKSDLRNKVENLQHELGLSLTRIGYMKEGSGVYCVDENGREMPIKPAGYNHFKDNL